MINNLDALAPCLFLFAGPVSCSPSATTLVFWGGKQGLLSLVSAICTAQGSLTDSSDLINLKSIPSLWLKHVFKWSGHRIFKFWSNYSIFGS